MSVIAVSVGFKRSRTFKRLNMNSKVRIVRGLNTMRFRYRMLEQ
ncbi:hypothetical protein [Candidatus Hodgkinia cicadicola]